MKSLQTIIEFIVSKRKLPSVLPLFVILSSVSMASFVNAQTNADIALSPTLFANETVKPKVILSVDNSGSMLARAYEGDNYQRVGTVVVNNVVYSGFFDSAACYSYDESAGNEYFEIESGSSGVNCGASGYWSGNFLNWLTMRRIDVIRNTLIGGVVKVVTASGAEMTRKAYSVLTTPSSISHYIVEGENISISGNGVSQWQGTNHRPPNAVSDNFSPFNQGGSGARFTLCTQKILVSKNGSRLRDSTHSSSPADDRNLDVLCSRPDANYDDNSTSNTNGVAEFKIRLKKTSEPTGLIIQGQDEFDFGVAVYNFDHRDDADGILDSSCGGKLSRSDNNCNFVNSIYRSNSVNGGTLQPCFPDETSSSTGRTNYDKCYETYAGADPDDLIDVIEYYPLIWGTTPIAETMFEIGGYIKQLDYHSTSSNGSSSQVPPHYYNAQHLLTGTGSLAESGQPSIFRQSYRLANFSTGDDLEWDPYYDANLGEYLPCTPVYIINLNDGEPFKDSGPTGVSSLWVGGAQEAVDAVTWSLRGDCRQNTLNLAGEDLLPGSQDVRSYFVFADLSLSLDADDARKVREGAAIGGADIQEITTTNPTTGLEEGTGIYEPVDSPFFPGDSAATRDPFTSTASGLETVVPLSSTVSPPTWDRDGDGEPDNYLLATSESELTAKISAVLNDISRRTASSSSAAVVTNGASGIGAIYQSLYHPRLVDLNNPSLSAAWSGSVWGLFIDDDVNFREDSNGNGALDASDNILTYRLDRNGTVLVDKTLPSGGSVTTVSIEQIKPIWNAVDYLGKLIDPTDAVTVTNTRDNVTSQRAYNGGDISAPAKGRYIITGDKGVVTGTFSNTGADLFSDGFGANNVGEFTASKFDHQDAPWFGIDCAALTDIGGDAGTDDECDDEVQNLVDYVRGDTAQVGKRNRTVEIDDGKGKINRILGDVVSSSPAVVGAPAQSYETYDSTYATFKAQYAYRRQVVYLGANDGMIHAFNGGFWDQNVGGFKLDDLFLSAVTTSDKARHVLGAELWAYVPVNLMPHLQWLDDVNYQHAFYVDGDPQAFDVKIFDDTDLDHPGGWGTILVVPMRMGGMPFDIVEGANTYSARSALVIFDITDPENPPELLGEFTDVDLGFTTSKPALVKNTLNQVDPLTGGVSVITNEWSLVFGSGPDILTTASVSAGKKPYIYSLNLKELVSNPSSSAVFTKALVGASSPDGFVGDVTAVDWDPVDIANGSATDTVAYGTIDGQSLSETGRLMSHVPQSLSADPTSGLLPNPIPTLVYNNGQPITSAPTFNYYNSTRWLYFGTGKLLVAADNASSQLQSFYGLKYDSAALPITSGVVNTTQIQVATSGAIVCGGACPGASSTVSELEAAIASPTVPGWQIDLANSDNLSDPSGRSVGNSVMSNGLIFFTEYVPPVEICDVDGQSYLYALDINTGTSTEFSPLGSESSAGGIDTSRNFIEFGVGQVKGINIVTKSDGTPVVVASDSTGSNVAQDVNLGAGSPAPASGRVSWRQIIL